MGWPKQQHGAVAACSACCDAFFPHRCMHCFTTEPTPSTTMRCVMPHASYC